MSELSNGIDLKKPARLLYWRPMLRLSVIALLVPSLVFGCIREGHAAFYDVAIEAGDVSFSPPELIIGTNTRIYATIANVGQRDVEGTVRFYEGDSLIGSKPFSVRAAVRPEDTWVSWTPQGYGATTIRVVVENDDAFADGVPANNAATLAIFVDRDTDGDGVPDRGDDDQDNDLILNADEIARGTNPLRADTDGDGVNDRTDVYPLDPRRSVAPPPAPRATPTPAAPAARRPTPTVQPATRPTEPTVLTPEVVTTTSVIDLSSMDTSTTTMVLGETIRFAEATTTADLASGSSEGAQPIARSSNSWNWALVIAAVASTVAAGLFVWLGRRRDTDV